MIIDNKEARVIPNTSERYWATEDGHIWDDKRKVYLKNGEDMFLWMDTGKRDHRPIDRWMILAWIGKTIEPTIWIDGDRNNNTISNLCCGYPPKKDRRKQYYLVEPPAGSKVIDGTYGRFYATRDGHIFDYKRGKNVREKVINDNGSQFVVCIMNDAEHNVCLRLAVARIIANAFIEQKPTNKIIHKDGDIWNNSVDNLMWYEPMGENAPSMQKEYFTSRRRTDEYRFRRECIHATWQLMLSRCGYDKDMNFVGWDKYPAYTGTQVCEEWKVYENFEKWYKENLTYNEKGIAIDKDLFGDGIHKIYSPSTCCFLPNVLNGRLASLNKIDTREYSYKQLSNGRYHTEVKCMKRGKRKEKQKSFDTLEELYAWRRQLEIDAFVETIKEYEGKLEQRIIDKLYERVPI